jgi:hypothetical protein
MDTLLNVGIVSGDQSFGHGMRWPDICQGGTVRALTLKANPMRRLAKDLLSESLSLRERVPTGG